MKTIFARLILLFLLSIIVFPIVSSKIEQSIYKEDLQQTLHNPSLEHPFGTDAKGRDMLWRALYGASLSLWMGIAINVLGVIIGLPFGCVLFWIFRSSGLLIVENLLAIPFFVLGGIFSILIGTSISSLLLSFGILFALPYAYMVQSYILNIRSAFFIERPLQIGRSFFSVCLYHIIPFIREKLFYQFWVSIHSTIFALASMTFLGFGLKPPLPEWGSLIYAALPYISEQPFLMIAPFLLFICLAWAIYEISFPLATKWKERDLTFYPPLSITPLSHSYIVAHVEDSKKFEASLHIEDSKIEWASFPQDYHQNFPDGFSIGTFLKDLLGPSVLEEKATIIEELLHKLDLKPDILQLYPKELSGGMLQRVSILIAKLCESPAILMGSPFVSLNESLKSQATDVLLYSYPQQTQLIHAPYLDLPPEYEKDFDPPLWLDKGTYRNYEEIQNFTIQRTKNWQNENEILTLENPQTSYPIDSIRECSLKLYPQEILGIVGYSGIGKTTLGKLLVGFLPLISGKREVKKSSFRCDMVLQNPDQFDENMSVWSLLREFDLSYQLHTKNEAESLLAQLSLPHNLLSKPMRLLTKGLQYQVLLLRSILYRPHLLVLDELPDHIEIGQYPKILTLLEELMQTEAKTCVIIISHKEPLLSKIADRILYLNEKTANLVEQNSNSIG